MKKTLILIGCLFLFRFSQAQDKSKQIDEVAARYTSFNKFNGSLLVAEKGKILLQKGYGYRDVSKQLPNDPQTIFLIGSITKEFTAAVVLKLVEQKKLALTDRLSKYYPDFPKGDSITIQNLLTHTSGIFNPDGKDTWEQSSQTTNEQQVLDFLKSKPLDFKPGEKFSYSNSGYKLLGYIIQKTTGDSYENVVSKMVFKPLHMTRSGFYFTALKDKDKAKGYWTFSASEYREGPHADPTQFIGSGEIYSTVEDLYKWHKALQAGRILSKALQQQAYRPFKKEYGYGWEIADSVNGRQVVGHAGRMLNGFEAKMLRVPDDDIFIILLNNNAAGPYLETISKDILSILYRKPFKLPEEPIKLTIDQMKAYTGRFGESKDRCAEVKIINGQLFLLGAADHNIELIPLKNNYFRFMDHEGEQMDFEFVMDSNGVAQSIIAPGRNGQMNTIKKLAE